VVQNFVKPVDPENYIINFFLNSEIGVIFRMEIFIKTNQGDSENLPQKPEATILTKK
jgi:hypothetical protein